MQLHMMRDGIPNKGSVQFLKHMYTWSSVEEVYCQHVFESDIDVPTNGWLWSVPEHANIGMRYKHVKHLLVID